ncbi:Tetratricopeptide repeat protein [Stratiformator vulcanicus]|uniref:Tetratricopeptide repeat protein n=2 Tax=Stratiformator vulcanicus TaxID=2527980 RepID=A0A517R725_9PLAN|nr:Tetratricopeptide repeat protein [Stratiformator vulcanicus]
MLAINCFRNQFFRGGLGLALLAVGSGVVLGDDPAAQGTQPPFRASVEVSSSDTIGGGVGLPAQTYLAATVRLENLSDGPITIPRDRIRLEADEKSIPLGRGPQKGLFLLKIGDRNVQTRLIETKEPVRLGRGESEQIDISFFGLPNGEPERLVLKFFASTGEEVAVDLGEDAAKRLKLQVEQTGPSNALGILTVSGTLDVAGARLLTNSLRELVGKGATRFVLAFDGTQKQADQRALQWLVTEASRLGATPLEQNAFPNFPGGINEFHISGLPENPPSPRYSYPQPPPRNYAHDSVSDAVAAALRTAIGQLSESELLAQAGRGHSLVRPAVIRIGAEHIPDSRLLIRWSREQDLQVRNAAITGLRHFGDRAAVDALVAFARGDDDEAAATALDSLAGSRFPTAHEALTDLLAGGLPASQAAVVRALGRHPRPMWSEIVYEAAIDPESPVRAEAIQTLVHIGHPQLLPLLRKLLFGDDEHLQKVAFSAVVNKADPDFDELATEFALDRLKSGRLSSDVLRLLLQTKDARTKDIAEAQFRAARAGDRVKLITLLAELGDLQTAGLLAESFRSMSAGEREITMRALSNIGSPQFMALAPEATRTGSAAVVLTTIQGLERDGSAEAVELLIEQVANSNRSIWTAAVNALAKIGSSKAQEALQVVMADLRSDRSRHVAMTLRQLRYRSPAQQFFLPAKNAAAKEQWGNAEELYTLAVEIDDQHAEAFAGRANARYQLGNLQQAMGDYQTALKLNPYDEFAITGLAILSVQTGGDIEAAIERTKEWAEEFENSALYPYNTACVYGVALTRLKAQEEPVDEKRLRQMETKAITLLGQSVRLGFDQIEWMAKDPDLTSLHGLPEYEAMLGEFQHDPPADQ